jgi:hypothetical protein
MPNSARPRNKKAAPGSPGDCFVICSSSGLYWSGSDWLPRWQDALCFADRRPYSRCAALCALLRSGGVVCNVAFIPSAAGGSPPRTGPAAAPLPPAA